MKQEELLLELIQLLLQVVKNQNEIIKLLKGKHVTFSKPFETTNALK